MFTETIHHCFDSHVHWLGTGRQATRLVLNDLKSPDDLRRIKIEPHHYQGQWLMGFGWDQSTWEKKEFPDRRILDELFSSTPVCFIRADAHSIWTNTEGLKRAGFLKPDGSPLDQLPEIPGGKVMVDAKGHPTGILVDAAKYRIDALIPEPSAAEIRAFLVRGMRVFNHAGFTHIRDMTCRQPQWNEALHLDESGLLTMAVELFFGSYSSKEFPTVLKEAVEARKVRAKNLRVKGIKIFCDGALGSEGAQLSRCYCSGSGHGLSLLTDEELERSLQLIWQVNMEAAVHVIGDEAAHRVATIAAGLWKSGLNGRLHLEHAEMLRPETIALLKGQNVICHMQPCHWHTDKRWLKDKLGDELYQYVFPWRALQEAGIQFAFGSDSPIERPSVIENMRALMDSAEHGIPKLLGDGIRYHQHPDPSWVANSYSHFRDGVVDHVVFRGEHLF